MAAATKILWLDTSTGSPTTLVTGDTVDAPGDWTFSEDVVISGDLTVNGTTTTINTTNLNLADRFILQNATNTGATENAGDVFVVDGASYTDFTTVSADLVLPNIGGPGFVLTADPTTGTGISVGDIILTTGFTTTPGNNGLWQVKSVDAVNFEVEIETSVDSSVNGIANTVVVDETAAGTLTQSEIVVDRANTDATMSIGTGDAVPLTFAVIATGSGTGTLQTAYDNQAGATVTGAVVLDFDLTGNILFNSTTAISIGSQADASTLSLGTGGARTINVGSASATEVQVDAVLVDINATTGGVTIDAGAASNFTTTAGDITIDAEAASVNIDGGEADAAAISIQASNAAGGIDVDAGTAGIDVLTTGGLSLDSSSVSVATNLSGVGAAGVDMTVEQTAGSLNLIGGEANAAAVRINASNAAGGMDIDAGTAGIAIDSTGAVSLDGVGASNFTTDGALTLSTSNAADASSSDVAVTAGNSTAGNVPGGAVGVDSGDGFGTGAGGAISLTGGDSGAGATGNGGAVNLTGGAATSTDGDGGGIVLTPGVNTGTGTPGLVDVQGPTGATVDEEDALLSLTNNGSGTGGGSTVTQFVVESDPSSAGITANVGSVAFRNSTGSGTIGQLWLKSGAADTAWEQLATGTSTLQEAYVAGNTITMTDANGDFDVSVTSGTPAISLDSADASNFTMTADVDASRTLEIKADNTNAGGSADAVLDLIASSTGGTGTINLTSDNTLNLTTLSSTINIAANAVAQTINVGTGAAAMTVVVGSNNTTSTTTVDAGSGGMTLDSDGAFTVDGEGIGDFDFNGAVTFNQDDSVGADGFDFTITGGAGDSTTNSQYDGGDVSVITGVGGNSAATTPGSGGALALTASTAGASNGTSQAGGAGGTVTITSGAGTDNSSGGTIGAGGAGGDLDLICGAGGSGGVGGIGGNINLTAGATGVDNRGGVSTGAAGGAITLTAGLGSDFSVNASSTGGAGGAITLTAGAGNLGGSAFLFGTGGTGGALSMTAGAGAASTNFGGVGGATLISSGDGGLTTVDSRAGGVGGTTTLTSGDGGTNTLAAAGTSTGGAGGATTISAGVGGSLTGAATTNNAGAGGAIILAAGAGGAASGASTNNDGTGGAVSIDAGASGGSGTDGAINIGTTTAATVIVGDGSATVITLDAGSTIVADSNSALTVGIVNLVNAAGTVGLFHSSASPDTVITASRGSLCLVDDGATGQVYVNTNNASTWSLLASASATTLQVAYDNGPAIVTDASGPVTLTGTVAQTTTLLDIDGTADDARTLVTITGGAHTGATAEVLLSMTNDAQSSGDALFINNLGTGDALDVQDGGSSVLTVTGTGAITAANTAGTVLTLGNATGAGSIDMDAGTAGIDITSTGDVAITSAVTSATSFVLDNGTATALTFNTATAAQVQLEQGVFIDAGSNVGIGLSYTNNSGSTITVGKLVSIDAATTLQIIEADATGAGADNLTCRAVGVIKPTAGIADAASGQVHNAHGIRVNIAFSDTPAAADIGKVAYVGTAGQAVKASPSTSGDFVTEVGIILGAEAGGLTPVLFAPRFVGTIA